MSSGSRISSFWIVLVVIQILIIGVLIFSILHKSGAISVAGIYSINQQNIATSSDSSLEHFFEPAPHSTGFRSSSLQSWVPEESPIRINANTLNHQRTFATTTPPDTYRLMTLGDSWTYGVYVPANKNFSGILSQKLDRECTQGQTTNYQVLNLGVPSYDIQYAAERFRVRGAPYKPDALLWLLSRGDFQTNFEKVQAQLQEQQLGSDEQSGEEAIRQRAQSITEIRKGLQETVGLEKLAAHQLEELKTAIHAFDGPVFIFSIDNTVIEFDGNNVERMLKKFAADNQNVFYKAIAPQWDEDARFPDHHPTEIGHARIATKLFDHLTADNIIPCSDKITE